MALGGAIAVGAITAGSALAASGGSPASGWHIGYYTPSTHGALSNAQAPVGAGIASLNFTNQPNTALLVTDQKAQNPTLLGDLTGKTIAATFAVTGAPASDFTYYGEGTPSNPCTSPASARLYFETSNKGGFDYTHFWWSNPSSAVLDSLAGTVTVTATVSPDQWSDWNGQPGTVVLDGFAAAASHVTDIGLSFGGGCFFENGVGTSDGQGTLTLISYAAS